MKRFLIALLVSTSVFGINALGQISQPFQNANAVLVTFADVSAEDAFDLVGRVLTDQHYDIEQADPSYLTMQTAVQVMASSFNRTGTTLVIRASVKSISARKTQVMISGSVGLLGQVPASKIGYRGVKGSVYMNGFDELQALAEQLIRLQKGEITYVQQ